MGSSTSDQAQGTWDRTKGKVKEEAGRISGDHDAEAEGRADQVKGSVEQGKGHAKDAVDKVTKGIKDAFD